MVTISLGNKKRTFKSIAEASRVTGISYMTIYMRLRFGVKPATALKRPVRKYSRRNSQGSPVRSFGPEATSEPKISKPLSEARC